MTEQQERVNKLIGRLEAHQKALGLNDMRFVARYQDFLRSTDTWRRAMVPRAWDRMGARLGKWEAQLQRLVATIDGGSPVESVFENLPIVQYGQALYDTLQGQQSDRRCGWIIGPTGVGKSVMMRFLVRQNPTDAVFVHVNPNWRDSLPRIAAGLARAVGSKDGRSAATILENATEALKAHPVTLILDDVHEGGILLCRVIKHLVDDTQAKFLLGTYPTGWNGLVRGATDAACEAQQLIGRSIKPINRSWMHGVNPADIQAFLKAEIEWTADRVLCERLAPILRANWNLRALKDALDLARMNADESGADLDAKLITDAVNEICSQGK
ncbi:MAG: ATP-binding protein [Kiritimatiellia bacterium]